ncbi:MAG: helix-turn-helix domain-containing protein [Oscillibacter sp.]|uniref:helix-turn-helix domain-containing protein n=1 Tax=Oscillibacter sp. TaxID=1945593 RepID=UPI001D7FDE7C|nr:helix-turn-helix domain-containing protein [Oscillibacter sp.]MBS6292164.1 helix-turn-helix domain-containing protein [Oscillibacter sp.]
MKKQSMFENYPDVVEVDDLRKMLGGISKKLAYRLLSDQEIRSVRVGRTYKIPKICVIEYLMGEESLQTLDHT